MDPRNRSARSLRCLFPVLAVAVVCASCSTAKPSSHQTGALRVPVTVPANCPISTSGSPTARAFIGIKATAKAGVTEKQLRPALPIPNGKTMPCASGADYAPGPPVQVDVFFLKGATTADQNTSATTMRLSGMFAVVTVQPPP
jgi:hypothetical protein